MRFEACATSYDAHAAPQRAFAAQVADFIRRSADEQIVEFGSGTGALTMHLCTNGAAIHATDASPAMVARGRALVPAAHWSQLDAFRARPPTSSLQVSSGLLHWAEDPVRVLQAWGTALTPGGRMVHAFPCAPCLAELRALIEASPVTWRDETAWRAVFTAAGLRVRRKELWIKQVTYPCALDLLRTLHRSGTTGRSHLNPGRLRRALRAYDLRHPAPGGVIATWAWLAMEAVTSVRG